MKLLFSLCTIFLDWLGRFTGLTYKEISVVFNLWIQGGILFLLSMLAFSTAIVYGNAGFLILTGMLFVLHILLISFIMIHYEGDMNRIFDQCVCDLMYLVKRFHTPYEVINILIFIVFFLTDIGLNTYIICLLS